MKISKILLGAAMIIAAPVVKRVCHKSMAHPFLFFSFFQIRN